MEADGDEALLRMDAGLDLNGNGQVDFKAPGTSEYGFERFVTKRSPLIGDHDVRAPRGDGEFRQTINATRLAEGPHFLTVRVYRHQPADAPAVFSEFRKVIYIDRAAPAVALDSSHPAQNAPAGNEVWFRSVDFTADQMHAFANPAASVNDAALLVEVTAGRGRLDRIDRALFKGSQVGLKKGATTSRLWRSSRAAGEA